MRENAVVAAFGMPGSGKSHILHARHTSNARHVITLGVLQQDLARDSRVAVALGLARLKAALLRAPDFDRWHIATALDPDEIRALFAWLVPPRGVGRSLARALGGVAIEVPEAYEVFPNAGTPPEVLAALRQGRHFGVDLYLASQRPASCARDVTAMASDLYLFAQTEPNDVAFIGRSVSRTVARHVQQLGAESHECIYVNRARREYLHLDPRGNVRARIDPMADFR